MVFAFCLNEDDGNVFDCDDVINEDADMVQFSDWETNDVFVEVADADVVDVDDIDALDADVPNCVSSPTRRDKIIVVSSSSAVSVFNDEYIAYIDTHL